MLESSIKAATDTKKRMVVLAKGVYASKKADMTVADVLNALGTEVGLKTSYEKAREILTKDLGLSYRRSRHVSQLVNIPKNIILR